MVKPLKISSPKNMALKQHFIKSILDSYTISFVHMICNSYRMSARGAWIGTTSARGNVNSKRRQPRGVYIPRAEVILIHAPRARIR